LKLTFKIDPTMAHLPGLYRLLPVLLVAAVTAPWTARADGDAAADTRRLLALLAGIGGEYQEAFDASGHLARQIEIEEAKLLLAEARDLNARLAIVEPSRLESLSRDLETGAPPGGVGGEIAIIAATVTERTGIRDEPLPPAPPSAERGGALFADNCVSCHGAHGDGGGEEAKRLGLSPAAFSRPAFMRGETPRDFFNVVSLGRRRAGMPEWGQVFSVQQRWDLVAYVWTLAHSQAAFSEGHSLYKAHCAGCHGAEGSPHDSQVPDLSRPGSLVDRTDAQLLDVVTAGAGSAMPGFGSGVLDEGQRWAVVTWIRALSLGGLGPAQAGSVQATASPEPPGPVAARASAAVAQSHALLDRAIAARRRGDAGAGALATDAYMRFEPIEKRVGAVDPAAVTHVEEGFVRVRNALREPGTAVPPALEAEVAQLHRHLDAAAGVLDASGSDWARFGQSAGIILREGFEVVLIVGALLTYVRRSAQTALVRPIWIGAGLGVVASIGTAYALATVFTLNPGASDALEGAAMLLAAGVLFWVSYWLISKAEAERWQRYIQGKVRHAVAAGSATALAAAAFLAVYREGFETVLFYRALLGAAPAGDVMVAGGLLAGLLALALVWVAMSRLGVRVPMRPFFLLTGAFLYLMAIVFAGRGVFELQDAGIIGLTPVAGAPRIPVLGLFPTLQTLAAQAVLVAALIFAAIVSMRRSRAGQPLDPRLASGDRRA
jgi:high-affinity iron transporter